MERWSVTTVTAAVLVLASCAAPREPGNIAPIAVPSLGLAAEAAAPIDAQWWKTFGDPQLDRILGDALAGSPTLEAALARVRLAESALAVSEAARRPQLTLDANGQIQRLSDAYIIPPPYGGSTRWIGQAQANLGWDLDFWGRQAAAVGQARAETDAAGLDYAAASLALAGSIAQTYIELTRVERQFGLAQRVLVEREQALLLVGLRVRSELAGERDARAAEILRAEAQQVLVRVQGQREMLVHALALLAGQGADYYATIRPPTPALDAVLPLPAELPADLLARRPDILSTQARVDAALAGRETARTAFYPNFNLIGLAGAQAIGLNHLFGKDAVTYGAGAAVHLPIFDGGRLRAEYAGANARVDAAIADYNQAVLSAVRETADALTRVANLSATLDVQRTAAAGTAELRRLDEVRFISGLGSRLELIDAELRLLSARQETVDLEADQAVARIRLLLALGGGFDSEAGSAALVDTRPSP
ncbi:RND transporter [Steroidobacter denitrificans]|uniref:RND transporter n=1 Tax=Steroidobacter denitrificans TaxID=465721 RepID=A0A127FDY2_STEDE|nr:efflux transporter outer membrane subunit [Steroidobacter denitrificans]AMN47945.1 RND transporter [Steroidobacter denitrificans]